MKFRALVLKSFSRDNGGVGPVQGRTRIARLPNVLLERNRTMSLYIILAAVSFAGIIGSIVVTARDGYRRQPRETFARTA